MPSSPLDKQTLRGSAWQRARALPEPLRFAIVGAIGFVVDGGVLSALLAIWPHAVLAARIPSFLVAATATWWLHRHFTFATTTAPDARRIRQWSAFLATNAAGNAVNILVYSVLATVAGWPPLLALAVASIGAAAMNYLASRGLVFRRAANRE